MVCLKQWDCFPYDEDENDIRQLTEDELANMLMFSDRDRKNNEKAERVYWLCIFEINRTLQNTFNTGKYDIVKNRHDNLKSYYGAD